SVSNAPLDAKSSPSAATGAASGSSGGGPFPASHTRPPPTRPAVPSVNTPFLMNSRRLWYSPSGVISLLGGSGGRFLMTQLRVVPAVSSGGAATGPHRA